jgi:hypothetical protein
MQAMTSCLLASALLLAVGCTEDLPSESGLDQEITASNGIAANRIAVNRIAVNRIAVNRIAVNRIAVNRIAVNAIGEAQVTDDTLVLDPDAVADLVSTPDGEIILEYLISCAFPETVSIEGPGFAGPRTYEGNLGLAPFWATRQLTDSEKGWISACMLARVNLNEIPIMISLRGPHPGLYASPEEVAEYSLEEGAFYGDIFTGEDPIVAIACGGRQEGSSTDIAERHCTEAGDRPGETACGFVATGACALACEARNGTNADNPFYERCHDRSTTNPKSGWAGSERYDQVITVFLR